MSKTRLMGILNITPDSFYDKSSFIDTDSAIARGEQIEKQGGDLIDIGGESSRPSTTYSGYQKVSEEEELRRTIPVIKSLSQKLTIPISIDTVKPKVAAAALDAGAKMINDVSGFTDPEMCEIASTYGVEICLMHMQGNPTNMQINPTYTKDVVSDLLLWFEKKIKYLTKSGIKNDQIIIDPGIGFGKTVDDNLKIIENLQRFKALGFPLLLGISRKNFMSKILNLPPSELLSTTLAINTIAIMEEVDIIRVHDVKEHREIIKTIGLLKLTKAKRP